MSGVMKTPLYLTHRFSLSHLCGEDGAYPKDATEEGAGEWVGERGGKEDGEVIRWYGMPSLFPQSSLHTSSPLQFQMHSVMRCTL